MTSPGKYLVDLAEYLELELNNCGREVSCVDLSYGNDIIPPQVRLGDQCGLRVDGGMGQNSYRAIDLTKDGQLLYAKNSNCSRGWRFDGLVRVTQAYPPNPDDGCHEYTWHTYKCPNTIGIVSESLFRWLEDQPDGEGVQTEYVGSYNGGASTQNIMFSMRLCMPDCETLLAEEQEMEGVLRGLRG